MAINYFPVFFFTILNVLILAQFLPPKILAATIVLRVCGNIPAFSRFCTHCNIATLTPPPLHPHALYLLSWTQSIMTWFGQRNLSRSNMSFWIEVWRVMGWYAKFLCFFFCPGHQGSCEARLLKCYSEFSLPTPKLNHSEWVTDVCVCLCVKLQRFGDVMVAKLILHALILCSIQCKWSYPCLYSVSLHFYYE